MENDVKKIPLSSLENSPDNVRRTVSKEGIIQLAASIAVHGLMQNLIVRPIGDKFQVVAGARRLKALQELAKDGHIENDAPITCRVMQGENTTELSLVENVVRESMHPADEYEAFAVLLKDGKIKVSDVAIRFGVSQKHVEQRMLLGNVHPDIMKAFRAEKCDLKSLMAFTITTDQKKQLNVWKSLKEYERSSYSIKQKLTDKMFTSDSPLAKFVGRDAYKKAGGQFHNDLFSTNESEFFEDGALLQKLADEKFNQRYEKLIAAGWGFVERGTDREEWSFCQKYETLIKEPKKEEKAKCGVYLFINNRGELTAQMLKPEKGSKAVIGTKKKASGISQALTDDLKAYRMEALQSAIADNTAAAMNLICYSAALTLLDGVYYGDHFSELHFSNASSSKTVVNEDTEAKKQLKKLKSDLDMSWNKGTEAQKFANFVLLTELKKTRFLAYAFARTLRGRIDEKFCTYTAAGMLANTNVASCWRPTKENYFSRISCEMLIKIGKEIFVKDWNSKLVTKKQLVTFLSDAFKDPKKTANGDLRIQNAIETWLPRGMAFEASGELPNAKLKKSA